MNVGYIWESLDVIADLLKQVVFNVLKNTEAIYKKQGLSSSQIEEKMRELKRTLDRQVDKILKKKV